MPGNWSFVLLNFGGVCIKRRFIQLFLVAFQDFCKKSPNSSSGKTKPYKKLGKILSRKHHHAEESDGEVRFKIPRSFSEPIGFQENYENAIELEEIVSKEHTSEKQGISEARPIFRRSISDPMGSQEKLEDSAFEFSK